ncbi:MAG: 50S ribosomal protein L11 methyltransferase, partial [Hyphomonadaceae bacterium]|nr:50S ribosomal protein L11 methyltransferase [Clostridia bacterium]
MKWIEVKVVTTPEASEAVSAMMYEMGVNGLYIEDPRDLESFQKLPTDWDYIEDALKAKDPNQVIIRAYLSEATNVNEKVTYLHEKLKLVKRYCEIETGDVTLLEVHEEDWANEWKQYYKPIKVGDRLVIKPTWEPYEKQSDDELILHLDPGMAFGTGTHETTRMCMQHLETSVTQDDEVLDIGCGSGILGIAALKLGASRCVSVDLDENAVRVSKENATLNEVEKQMTFIHGNLVDVVTGQYDVIVANIIADAILYLSTILT